jgi:hypothetical protein
MGVHDKNMYPAIKELLGIPQDEPIFILRAQDQMSLGTIDYYRDRYQVASALRQQPQKDFHNDLDDAYNEFDDFQSAHSSRVKMPD